MGRKKVKTNVEEPGQTQYYPFLTQNQSYPSMNTFYNPYSFSQYQGVCNPFGDANACKNVYGSYMNGLSFNPYNPFMQQQMVNYPLFCMPYQPTFSIDVFQQQA
jgi:hypothetical protein